jgi:uncharacterized protein YbaR (Trm112 family)
MLFNPAYRLVQQERLGFSIFRKWNPAIQQPTGRLYGKFSGDQEHRANLLRRFDRIVDVSDQEGLGNIVHRTLSIGSALRRSRGDLDPIPLRSLPGERYTGHTIPSPPVQGASQMPNPTVKEVETRLETVQCAICKGSSFGIDERSMQADGEWRGICRKCYYTFPIYTDMEFYLRTQPDIPYRLKEMSCPTCNHQGVSLNFRITMSVRESIYFLTCTSCQKTYPERSSLEAFE